MLLQPQSVLVQAGSTGVLVERLPVLAVAQCVSGAEPLVAHTHVMPGLYATASQVMPLLHHNTPGFNSGIMIYNAGLHYGTPGADGKPANSSQLYRDLEGLVVFKQRYGREMPKLVWMDTPVQVGGAAVV